MSIVMRFENYQNKMQNISTNSGSKNIRSNIFEK